MYLHPYISAELIRQRRAELLAAADSYRRASSLRRRAGHRAVRQRRFGQQVWTLLHAQALLDGPVTHPHQR